MAATAGPNPARTRPTTIAKLAARLTPRDWWLLDMLHAHRVLNSSQVLRLAFRTQRTCNIRLRSLAEHSVIDTFRPHQPRGSAPTHLTLGPAGAAALAARRATTVRELPWRNGETDRIAHSTRLAHTVEANELMVRLAAEHRTRPERELLLWLPPSVCAHLWGDWIRPDAYGLHHDTAPASLGRARGPGAPGPVPGVPHVPQVPGTPEVQHPAGRVTGFFLEYDRGTEPGGRVAAKLDGYAAHAAGTRTRTPLLIHTTTPVREQLLRTRLAPLAADLDLPVATTHADLAPADRPLHVTRYDHDTRPTAADPVWLPLTPVPHTAGRHGGNRLRLADLAEHLGDFVPALGIAEASDPDWAAVPPLPPSRGGTP
ncbi:replication-relaxation family protein [Yinghuangia sp. YIM S09857]|uniref:replication-relaxation family protein n=1 Tax=Yinghuangia sp. YIM S09857 TaxID=3436929 RepID=UPI003F529F29